ncbi:hypothetical protein BDM02DRAFT_3128351 [Thelephora ganbajun]|uniref:Uncharacterized protein n=1 Tax=Thelephora ganbajun TaxID=370292 RepID=A0ACB6ZIV9_THEGA|nr:hypothetical protein BDM02DRAFT_3128351 [Thelephora ganbajun]
MGETTIDPKALEDAMLKALPTLFPHLLGTASNARVDFYDKFQREADEYDRDFMKKYEEDLNTTLIFAGLFSAVTSAFIVAVQTQLQPDYTQMSYDLLTIIASVSLGKTPTGPDAAFPQWGGPDPTTVHVQAILYSSLAASLLAALIAMLGKQWLNRYSQVEMRGSVIDRSRHRQGKMNGMVTWRFNLVMESLPLMLQAALLLLGYALSNWLYFINKAVASVLIGFTAFGILFYILIVSAATLSYNCPFQTPLSLVLRFLIHFDDEHRKYLKRTRKWFVRAFSQKKKKRPRPKSGPSGLGKFGTFDGSNFVDHIELPMAGPSDQPAPLFNKETDWHGYVLDSNCIAWMFHMSIDADVILAMMRFIPEVVWHAGIKTTPLEGLYDTVLECFDRSTGHPVVIPKLKNKAYLGAKALLHLTIQRKCISDESDMAVFKSISNRHPIMGSKQHEGDSDLESTLGIIDRVFGDFEPMDWENFSFTIPHHSWMGHILLYRAWDVLGKNEPLPDDIREFVLHSLKLEPPPPAPIVVDCLFIIGLVLGIKLHIDDLLVGDKSRECNPQIGRIYEKLTETFQNPNSTPDEIDRVLEAMKLIAPLSESEIAEKSYNLFHVVMQTPVSAAYSQEKKWEASRLTMHGAYKWDKYLPWVGEPRDILTFLDRHFDLATREDQNQDEPIQNALRALAYAANSDTIEALKHFDPTEPSFVRGICYVYQDDKPFQLRKAALFFLPLIGDRWFNTPDPIMEPDQMNRLCVDWASAVDGIEHTYDVQKATLAVLFGMINSPHWRPYIVTDKWKLLEYFTSVPDDSQPLKRCIDNPELMDAIANVPNPAAIVLWLAILWLKYKELIPEVQEQLETVTKEVAQSKRRPELDMYLSVMDSELKKAEDALTQHNTWSTDPAAVALRTKIDNLQQARAALVTLKRG